MGADTANLQTDVVLNGVTSGVYYELTYRALNVHGQGAVSDPVVVLAASEPTQMANPVCSLVGPDYHCAFTEPSTGGNNVAITQYELQVRHIDGTFITPTTCQDQTLLKSLMYCTLSLTSLETELGLSQGSAIVAQVRAENEIGWSPYSLSSNSVMMAGLQS